MNLLIQSVSERAERDGSRQLHLNKSVILSYLIITFTTKSLILAQDER